MSALTDAFLARAQEDGYVRYGLIEAVDGGLASVRMGGVTVEGATWCRDYLPVVGDRVAVLAGDSGWLILDAVEPVKRVWVEPQEMVLPDFIASADGQSQIQFRELLGNRQDQVTNSWDDDLSTDEYDPKLPERLTDQPWTLYLPGPDVGHMAWTGLGDIWGPGESGEGYLNYRPRQSWSQVVVRLSYYRVHPNIGKPGIEALLPDDARVEMVTLRVRLSPNQSAPGVQRFRMWGMPPGNVVKYEDLEPMEFEAMPGDSFDVNIDGDWLLAFRTNLIDGFIIDAGPHVPTVRFSDLGGSGSYSTDDLLRMIVRYSTPLEED